MAITAAVWERGEIFAANRAESHVALSVKSALGATRRATVHEHGSLRVRCPGPVAPELEAVIVNTAGGIAGGDRLRVDVTVGTGAALVVTSAAAEKVYRTDGPDAAVAVNLTLAAGARLAWLPQETILFDRAGLRRSIDVDLAADAELLLVEAIVFGRSDMGERVQQGRVFDRWRIRRDGCLVYAETLRMDGHVAAMLRQPAVANGGAASASVVMAPGDERLVQRLRVVAEGCRGDIGVSAWNGIAVARLCARDGAALRHDLILVLTELRGRVLPRLWSN